MQKIKPITKAAEPVYTLTGSEFAAGRVSLFIVSVWGVWNGVLCSFAFPWLWASAGILRQVCWTFVLPLLSMAHSHLLSIFLFASLQKFLHILETSPLQIMYCEYLSPVYDFSSFKLDNPKVNLISMWSTLSIFLYTLCLFHIHKFCLYSSVIKIFS